MKLIIDLPDEVKTLFDNADISDLRDYYDFNSTIGKAIKNGTPLPKGHGALKDASELLNMTKGYKSELGRLKADPFVKCGIETVENFIKEMPTIIEADKESD